MAQQKRSATEANAVLEGVEALLIDIEGTTTPCSFVQEKVYPYIKENITTYLTNHYEDEECTADIAALREQATKDKADGVEGATEIPDAEASKEDTITAVTTYIAWALDANRVVPCKQIQGHMMREAYKTGKITADLFEDVAPAIKQLVEEGKKVYIYSNASVEEQKLHFSRTDEGDLREVITGYFDATTAGDKKTMESYKKIATEIDVKSEEILYLTDAPQEAAAAVKSGMQAQLITRPGNPELTEDDKKDFAYMESFDELFDIDDEGLCPPKKMAGDEANGDADDVDDLDEDDEDDIDEAEADAEAEAEGEN